MMPIELRWLVRGDGHEDSQFRDRLQFRVAVHPDAARSYAHGQAWSDWQEVPEVQEEP